jgi:predicted chitinase
LALALGASLTSGSSAQQVDPAKRANLASRIRSEAVVALFPKKAAKNIAANWPLVQTELQRFGLGDSRPMIIYALATIRVETGTFAPNPEQPSRYSKTLDRPGYAGIQASGTDRPYGAYDSTIKFRKDGTPIINKQLGNCLYTGIDEKLMRSRHGMPPRPECDDGILFRGRGFIQLTGRYNYEQMQKEITGKVAVDIVKNPDEAGRPEVAAKILAAYLANCKAEVEGHMNARRFSDARKVVNKAALGLPEFEAFVVAAEKALP